MNSFNRFFKNDGIRREHAEACINFFKKLSDLLYDDYEIVKTGTNGFLVKRGTPENGVFRISDHYLVPYGTRSKITYYSKPHWSFRISDHWNWFAELDKCDQKNYIQCFCVDLPRPTRRTVVENFPVHAIQVALFGNCKDEAYHCVFGEYKEKGSSEWKWMESTPEEVIEKYGLA